VPVVARPVVTVIEPGLFTTVQDLGRPGYRDSGVPLSGAADAGAMRLANLLVGNPEGAAGLECTLVGPTLRFERDVVIALVGAEFPGLPHALATKVTAGTVVSLGHACHGCRGCLAIAGGIEVEPVLGSRSTLVTVGLGGFAGRSLAKGDVLGIGEPERTRLKHGPRTLLRRLTNALRPCVLRVVPGEQASTFGHEAWSQTYHASSRSDRMGVRLDGPALDATANAGGMASVAVFPGTVQIPPDGRPIVLLADAQTTGGYPVLGHLIEADLPKAAQLRPGDDVRFKPVTTDEAVAALRERDALIAAFRESLR
jgi:antagonist of KipI